MTCPGDEKRAEQKNLKNVIFVTAGIMAIEIFQSLKSGSLALLSDDATIG